MQLGPMALGFNRGSRFNPALLFGASTAGAFYDPSDLSSMYQDSAGTTPAAVDSPVGLLLDKRLGLVRGAEGVGAFSNVSTGTGTAAYSNGTLTITGADTGNRGWGAFAFATVAGQSYEVTVNHAVLSGGLNASWRAGTTSTGNDLFAGGAMAATNRAVFRAAGATSYVNFFTSGAQSNSISALSVRELPGNHATQATAAARPMLRRDSGGRLYLELDGVDDFLSASFAIAQPWDRISAIRQTTWTDFDRIMGSPTGLGGRLLQTGVSPSVGIHSGAFIGISPNLAVGTNGVITERHNGANSRVALNNNAYVTGNAGTTAVDGITLGAGGGSNFANVRIYGVLMIAPSLTDGETAQVRTWMAGRAGVSL